MAHKRALAPLLLALVVAVLAASPSPVPLTAHAAAGIGTARAPAQTAPILTVAVGDLRVAYRVLGQGEPLLLIAAWGATMDDWNPTLLTELAAHYLVIVFDNRGVGGTTGPSGDLSIAQLADDTAGFMATLSLERAHVLGYSMGGFIAQELALRYPSRVASQVLMGAGCGGTEGIGPTPEVVRALDDRAGSAAEVTQRILSVLLPERWIAANQPYLRSLLALPRESAATPEIIARQWQAIEAWPGTCERLPSLRAPTLILTGAADQVLVPANAVLLADRLPGAWLAQFAGGGHGMQHQYPKPIASLIHAFLQAP
jgi:pimeloyl-ACP methyl ester carboxylesterase